MSDLTEDGSATLGNGDTELAGDATAAWVALGVRLAGENSNQVVH